MAINYAIKYATKIAERFKKASITADDCGHAYTWLNPNSRTIRIGSVNTVPETQYTRSGSHRFGDASWPDRRLVALSGSHRLGGCCPCLAGPRPFSCLEPQRKLGNPGGMTWNCPSGISSASVQG